MVALGSSFPQRGNTSLTDHAGFWKWLKTSAVLLLNKSFVFWAIESEVFYFAILSFGRACSAK